MIQVASHSFNLNHRSHPCHMLYFPSQTICGIFDSNAFESCETGKAACRWAVSLNRASFTFLSPKPQGWVVWSVKVFLGHLSLGPLSLIVSRASFTSYSQGPLSLLSLSVGLYHFHILVASVHMWLTHYKDHFHYLGASFTVITFHGRGLFLASSLINSSCLPNTRHYSRLFSF